MKKTAALWSAGVLAIAIAGLVNAGTGTFYDASNFGASGGGGGGAGDVVGPASATDNAVCRYDGTTGKLIQNSTTTLSDIGALTMPITSTIALSATGSNLTIVGSTVGDASSPGIQLDDTGPAIRMTADSTTWKSGNGAITQMVLAPSFLSTVYPVTAVFPGAGSSSTTIGPSSAAGAMSSTAYGDTAVVGPSADFGMAIGPFTTAGNDYSAAFVYGASAPGTRSLAMGYLANSGLFTDTICIGTFCSITADYGLSIGTSSAASNQDVSIGYFASSTGPGGTPSVCVGSNCTASVFGTSVGYLSTSSGGSASYGYNSSSSVAGTAMGPSTVAAGDAFAGGFGANAGATDSVSIGFSSVVAAAHTNSVCIGANCATSAANQMQLGASGTPLAIRAYSSAQITSGLGVWNHAPPGAQPAAIADASGGAVIDVQCRAALNSLLAASRGMGMIAP